VVKVRIRDMLQMIHDGKMPLGKPNSVPAEQVAKLQAWADAGAPEGSATAAPAPSATAAPSPAASAVPSEAASAAASPGAKVVAFQDVVPILKSHCATCHVTGGIGPFAMFDAAGAPQYATVRDHLGGMIDAIKTGKMPLGNPGSVPANEIALLEAWQAAGAPETGGPAATLAPGASPTPSSSPSATPTPVGSLPPVTKTVQFTADVVPILRQHCSACHVTGGIGPFAMFDASGTPQYQTVHDRIKDMITAIKGNVMPLGKPGSVPAESIAVLQAWSDAGAPADQAAPGPSPTSTGAATASPTSSASPAATARPTYTAPSTPTPSRVQVSFTQNVVPILHNRCSACHSSGGPGATKVPMFNVYGIPNYTAIHDNIGNMIQMIQEGKMPQNAPGSVPASEVQTLQNWKDMGAPYN
jgi:uncharacterized membrane protein